MPIVQSRHSRVNVLEVHCAKGYSARPSVPVHAIKYSFTEYKHVAPLLVDKHTKESTRIVYNCADIMSLMMMYIMMPICIISIAD